MPAPLRHALLALWTLGTAYGHMSYQARIPNGNNVWRNGQRWSGVGHVQSWGGPSAKNPFGRDFQNAGESWTTALCRLDSDGDGQANGVELGDPDCVWSVGATPARTSDISHPGYADSVTSSTLTSAPTPPPAPTPLPTPALAPPGPPAASAVGSASDISLAGAGKGGPWLSFKAVGQDSVEFTLRLDRTAWLGLGISTGSAASMDAGGQGSDVVACTDGEVRRYWVTSKSVPLNGYVRVPGSSCTQANGATVMTFVRKVAAESSRERALTPGALQQVIFAYGDNGGTSISYHGHRMGAKRIDFSTGASEDLAAKSGPAPLYLHLVLMSLAWAGLLPFGAVAANRLKRLPRGPQGAWFRLHVRSQVVGWVLQLLGVGAAVWYAQAHSHHFHSLHAWLGICVVIVGTLQPLNAALRPHAEEPKSKGRVVWEVVHKGFGWVAVVLGLVNVILGILAANNHGYGAAVLGTAGGLAAASALPAAALLLMAAARPDNAVSRWLVGSSKDGEEAL